MAWRIGVIRAIGAIDLVKTTALARVAGNITDLVDRQQNSIAVAVIAQGLDLLNVARGCALVPKFLARSAPVVGLAGRQGLLDRLAVHPGQHQNRAVEIVLGHGCDEAAIVKPNAIEIDAAGQRIDGVGRSLAD